MPDHLSRHNTVEYGASLGGPSCAAERNGDWHEEAAHRKLHWFQNKTQRAVAYFNGMTYRGIGTGSDALSEAWLAAAGPVQLPD